jgi:hypothetical protein
MRSRMQASAYPASFEAMMACEAVEPFWDFEDLSPRESVTDELPIDHAAILGTLVPLLATAMVSVTLLVTAAL